MSTEQQEITNKIQTEFLLRFVEDMRTMHDENNCPIMGYHLCTIDFQLKMLKEQQDDQK